MSTLLVHSHRQWLLDDFAAAGVIPVAQSRPWDPTAPAPDQPIWAPGAWAMRLAASGVELDLASPGAGFLAELAGAHPDLVGGRRIVAGPVGIVGRAWRTEVFAKPSEAKLEHLPARRYPSGGCLRSVVRCAGYPEDLHVTLSAPADFVREFRCFTAHGQVAAASFYWDKVTGQAWDAFAGPQDPGLPPAAAAARFAQQVLDRLGPDQPPGFVLDVGQDRHGSFCVVEANASWSSAPYHAPMPGVLSSVLASQGEPVRLNPRWRFTPDPVLAARALPVPRLA